MNCCDFKQITATLSTLLIAVAGVAQEWEFVETPSPNPIDQVFACDAAADDDIWAVGGSTYFVAGGFRESLLFSMHYDGETWEPVHVDMPEDASALQGVLALAADNVLAVGSQSPVGAAQTMVLRYDGSSWSQISSPQYTGGSGLFDIGRAGSDVWAVGVRRSPEPPPAVGNVALALRWTGSGWEEAPAEPLAELGGRGYNYIRAVDGISEDDAWGVGVAQQTGSTDPFGPTLYITRYNGSVWEVHDIGMRDVLSTLLDVAMIAEDDAWAVGTTAMAGVGDQPLILHWDGSSWTRVDLPIFDGNAARLETISVISPDEIYAAGTNADGEGWPRPLMMKYDGVAWREVSVAPTDGKHEWFFSSTLTPGGDLWALGKYNNPESQRPLAQVLRAEGGCRADLDGDGQLTFFDFLAFQNLFAAGAMAADFDGDGQLTFFDFLAFQNEFAAGCA